MGVNQAYLSQDETDKKAISDKMLHEVAHALGVDEGKLFSIVGRTPYRVLKALATMDDLQRLTYAAHTNLTNEQLGDLTYAVEHGMDFEVCPKCLDNDG